GTHRGPGGRAHRAGRFPHHSTRGWGRPVERAHSRGEDPHAGAAVTREATLIAGDGIGPEITQVTLQVLDALGVQFDWDEQYGGFDRTFKVGNAPKALAQATSVMTRDGCRRIVRYAFEYARRHDRRKVTVVHKANILKATSGLFLETARMIAKEYEGQIASDE